MTKIDRICKNVICIQHLLEACSLDLGDSSHVTCVLGVCGFVSLCLVVSFSGIYCLRRLVSEMNCCVSSGALNPTHSLTITLLTGFSASAVVGRQLQLQYLVCGAERLWWPRDSSAVSQLVQYGMYFTQSLIMLLQFTGYSKWTNKLWNVSIV